MSAEHITSDREAALVRLAAGGGDETERNATRAHVETCSEGCKERLAALLAAADTADDALKTNRLARDELRRTMRFLRPAAPARSGGLRAIPRTGWVLLAASWLAIAALAAALVVERAHARDRVHAHAHEVALHAAALPTGRSLAARVLSRPTDLDAFGMDYAEARIALEHRLEADFGVAPSAAQALVARLLLAY